MEKFKSFITEAKNEDYRIVVLSVEHGDNAITAKRIKEEADKLKLPNYIVGIDGTHISYNNGTYTIHAMPSMECQLRHSPPLLTIFH